MKRLALHWPATALLVASLLVGCGGGGGGSGIGALALSPPPTAANAPQPNPDGSSPPPAPDAKAPAATFTLSVVASGSGTVRSDKPGIDCPTACSADYASGTELTLTPTAAAGWRFAGWSGACTGTTPACRITLNAAKRAVASFDQTSPTGYGPRVTPGIEPGVQLRDAPAGWSTSADDQVVEGLIFRSPVTIRHARVHFKNCLWLTAVGQTYPGGNHWAFDPAITDDPKIGGLIFEHNDFADALPAFGSGDPNQPWIVRASIMRGTSDGYGDSAKGGSNVLIEDSSFVYEHPSLSFAHGDGLQSDVGNVVHMKVRYSYFDVRRTGSNAALLQNEQADEVGDWLIERNYIRSPSAYAIRARNLTGHGRVVIRNNMIERTWIYGPLDSTEHEDMIDWLDNVDEKGQPVLW